MSASFTDDPFRDFDNYDREQAEKLDRLPKCRHCGEPIQDDYAFEYEGDLYCEECFDWWVKELMRVPTEGSL